MNIHNCSFYEFIKYLLGVFFAMQSSKECVILFNHLVQDKTFLFMAKFKSNRYWRYLSVLKKTPSICHMTEGQQRKIVEAQRCDLINEFSKKARKWWTDRKIMKYSLWDIQWMFSFHKYHLFVVPTVGENL